MEELVVLFIWGRCKVDQVAELTVLFIWGRCEVDEVAELTVLFIWGRCEVDQVAELTVDCGQVRVRPGGREHCTLKVGLR